MYKFTALLNTKLKQAYLSGNNNCRGDLTLKEMFNIAKDTTGLNGTADYVKWAHNLSSIDDFEFNCFYSETKENTKNRATKFVSELGITIVGEGRVTIASDRT